MKVLIVSTHDISAGAARAAYRLCEALNAGGVECEIAALNQSCDAFFVRKIGGVRAKVVRKIIQPYIGKRLEGLQKTDNENLRSLACFGAGVVDYINAHDADIVNLHWVHGEMLAVQDFMRIRKPVVWTLHDMWAFAGAEHYVEDGPSARWREGYTDGNRSDSARGVDLDRWVWNRKRRHWKHKLNLVTPSRWLSDCSRESALLSDWPVETIANPLDLETFRPWPREVARRAFNLPIDKKLILFGAHGVDRPGRKGVDLLYAAMRHLNGGAIDAHGVIFGRSAPVSPPDVGVPLHWVGRLNDDIALALLYSAADVMVVPSRMDNLPQTGTEAQSCGCPVVAFKIGGLPDIVEHRVTGYLAEPFDVEDLANGIQWVLEASDRTAVLSSAARERSTREWATEDIVGRYKSAYEAAIRSFHVGEE